MKANVPTRYCKRYDYSEKTRKVSIESILESKFGDKWSENEEIGQFYINALSFSNPDSEEISNETDDEEDPDIAPCNCLEEDPCHL